MNHPDTHSETNAGQPVEASGQDQDKTALPTEAELERDLRRMVRAGKNLNISHCRSLVGVPKLTLSISTEIETQRGIEASVQNKRVEITPVLAQRVVRSAINYLYSQNQWRDGDREQYLAHCAEFFYRLFGFTKDTQQASTEQRWAISISYYERHLNTHGRSTEEGNFRRRIYEDELLPILIGELLKIESGLRGDMADHMPAINATAAWLMHKWKLSYWVAFTVRHHLLAARNYIAFYLAVRDGSEPIPYGIHPYGDPNILIRESLFHLTVIVRFARDPWASNADMEFSANVLDYVDEQFSFSKSDQEWLDEAVDSCEITRDSFTGDPFSGEILTEFTDRLDSDPRGRLIFAKYLCIVEACQCRREYMNWDGDEACPILGLRKRFDELAGGLDEWWLANARAAGGRISGGIPPRRA